MKSKIGEGAFAKVFVGERNHDKTKFAVKVFDKKELLKHRRLSILKKAIAKEILIQRIINVTSNTKLYEVYESNDHIYLVMQYLYGGELFDKIIEIGYFNEHNGSIIMN